MRSSHLTDDDLWRAIAENTDAMSIVIEKQIELDLGIGGGRSQYPTKAKALQRAGDR